MIKKSLLLRMSFFFEMIHIKKNYFINFSLNSFESICETINILITAHTRVVLMKKMITQQKKIDEGFYTFAL